MQEKSVENTSPDTFKVIIINFCWASVLTMITSGLIEGFLISNGLIRFGIFLVYFVIVRYYREAHRSPSTNRSVFFAAVAYVITYDLANS